MIKGLIISVNVITNDINCHEEYALSVNKIVVTVNVISYPYNIYMGIVKNKDNSLIDRLLRFRMATNEPTNDYYSFIGGKKDAEPIEPEKEKKVEQTTTFEERFKHRFRDPKLLPPPPPPPPTQHR